MTDVRTTQVAVEHWVRNNPAVQATQAVAEHWMTVEGVSYARATQVIVEHWTSAVAVGDPPKALTVIIEPIYVIPEWAYVRLYPDEIMVFGGNNEPGTIIFTVTTPPVNGRLRLADGVTPVTSFTYAQLKAGAIRYYWDSGTADSFSFTVDDPVTDPVGPLVAPIVAKHEPPDQIYGWGDPLSVPFGGSATVTDNELYAYGGENDPDTMVFTVIRPPVHGTLTIAGVPVTSFTQTQINDGELIYTHDGTPGEDSFECHPADPLASALPVPPYQTEDSPTGTMGCVWHAPFTDPPVLLGELTFWGATEPVSISADGTTVVGGCWSDYQVNRGVKWDTATGAITELSYVAADETAFAISDDCSRILGCNSQLQGDSDGQTVYQVNVWEGGGATRFYLPLYDDSTPGALTSVSWWGRPQRVMSLDGSVVVGSGGPAASYGTTKWVNGVNIELAGLGSGQNDGGASGLAVTADGTIVVGVAGYVYPNMQPACYWLGTELRLLATPAISIGGVGGFSAGPYALSCNADASVIWGYAPNMQTDQNNVIGYWDNTLVRNADGSYGVFHVCEELPNIQSGYARVFSVADDPGVAVAVGKGPHGSGDERAYKFVGTTAIDLGSLDYSWSSEALGCNHDGSIVVGWSDDAYGTTWPLWWDATNTMRKLPTINYLDDNWQGMAIGISRDGSAIFGYVEVPFVDEFIVTIDFAPPPVEVDTDTVTVPRGGDVVVTSGELEASGGEMNPATMTLTVVTPPAHGELRIGGTPVTSFTQAQVDAGLLVYVNNGDTSDTDSFGVIAYDPSLPPPPTLLRAPAVIWRYPFTTVDKLDLLSGGTAAYPTGVTGDGKTLIGYGGDGTTQQPLKWDRDTLAATQLTKLSGNYETTHISQDGQTIVARGGTGARITRYTAGGTVAELLPIPAGGYTGTSHGIGQRALLDDGSASIGYAYDSTSGLSLAGIWVGLAFTALPLHPYDNRTQGWGGSQNGSIKVGNLSGNSSQYVYNGCYYVGSECRVLDHNYTGLQPFPPNNRGLHIDDCNGDGTIIYGDTPDWTVYDSNFYNISRACYWDNLNTSVVRYGTETLWGVPHFLPNILNEYTGPPSTWGPSVRHVAEIGAVAVGQSMWPQPSQATKWVGAALTVLSPRASHANSCNADGSRVSGNDLGTDNLNHPVWWDETDTMHILPTLPDVDLAQLETGHTLGMSRDGTLIYGVIPTIEYLPSDLPEYTVPIMVISPPITLETGTVTVPKGGSTVVPTIELHAGGGVQNPAVMMLTVVGPPQHGTLTGLTFTQAQVDAGLISYSHNGDNATEDWFTVTASDPSGRLVLPETLRASFTAAEGTNLSDYNSDMGGGWVAVNGEANAKISYQRVMGLGGEAMYRSTLAPATADYSVQFAAVPPSYNPPSNRVQIWAIARAGAINTGYRLTVTGDGAQYLLVLSVGATPAVTVPMGLITGGWYNVVRLGVLGSTIFAQVQRNQDDKWLASDGTWQVAETSAAQITDTTYTEPGSIMLGGVWL